jgi:CcmD family protein
VDFLPLHIPMMRPIRTALFALAILFAAAAAAPSLPAQAPAETSVEAPATTAAAAAPAPGGAASLPRYTPPRTLRAYAHVFIAFTVAWVLLFGYVIFLARKFRRVEEQVAALSRA